MRIIPNRYHEAHSNAYQDLLSCSQVLIQFSYHFYDFIIIMRIIGVMLCDYTFKSTSNKVFSKCIKSILRETWFIIAIELFKNNCMILVSRMQ